MVVHILRQAGIDESEKASLRILRKRMPPCPICGRKASIIHCVADGFDFGYSAGCPVFCLGDGIHVISDIDDTKAPRVDSWSAERAFAEWIEYCERMGEDRCG